MAEDEKAGQARAEPAVMAPAVAVEASLAVEPAEVVVVVAVAAVGVETVRAEIAGTAVVADAAAAVGPSGRKSLGFRGRTWLPRNNSCHKQVLGAESGNK